MRVIGRRAKDADKIANHVDRDQTAPKTGSTLFAQTCLFECLLSLGSSLFFSHCLCGRDKGWHDAKDIETSEPQEYEPRRVWHPKTHSVATHTDSFGVIQFQGFGQESSDSPVSCV